jgi:hypothetical protein
MSKESWAKIVAQGKRLAQEDRGETRFKLGDLALKVAPMGEGHGRTGSMETLSEYAEEIGVKFETLDQYRKVAAAWPQGDRSPSADWTLHLRFMGQSDRAELIQAEWTAAEARALVKSRKPRKLGISRNDKWWEAEKAALQQLRNWDAKKVAGLSAAEAKRRAEFIREHIELEQRVVEELEARSYTRSL